MEGRNEHKWNVIQRLMDRDFNNFQSFTYLWLTQFFKDNEFLQYVASRNVSDLKTKLQYVKTILALLKSLSFILYKHFCLTIFFV